MVSGIKLVLLGFWVGVIALFSFVVAPAAFAVLPSTHLAASVVSRVLSPVEVIGICVSVLLLVFYLVGFGMHSKKSGLELVLLLLMPISVTASHFFVSRRLREIRLQFGEGLASLSPADAARSTFDLLHRVSVGLMGFDLVVSLALIGLILWRSRGTDARV